MKNKILMTLLLIVGVFYSCSKSELDIKNPNDQTLESLKNENGIFAFALGGVYYTMGPKGLNEDYYYDGVQGPLWAGAMGYHSLLGDEVGVEAANAGLNQIACPDAVKLDNGTTLSNPQNPATQFGFLRQVNTFANGGASNPHMQEWGYMYAIINTCNRILGTLPTVAFTGNAKTKQDVLKAYAYWWKGWAYSHLGSFYYAGIINNDLTALGSNGNYVTKEKLITEAAVNLDQCATVLGGLTAGGDYDKVLKAIIPSYCQVGRGGIPTPTMWKHSINTLKARNILVNTPTASMDAAKWAAVKALVDDGVVASDYVFTGRSSASGEIWPTDVGHVTSQVIGDAPGDGTYKLSERLVQDYKSGDKRAANNFVQGTAWQGAEDRGITYNTRWVLKDGGAGIANASVYGSSTPGGVEFFLASSSEENELMKAEVAIYSGQTEAGLDIIDKVRASQGAGLLAVKGTNLSVAAAKEELRKERRCALAFRGLAWYDLRRSGQNEKGSSRTGCVVLDKNGTLNLNASISYNFLDYWDVPAAEIKLNPATAGSAPTKNPK
jgi:starch-binding outer membrane protein, SusD/RagB family